MSGEMVVVIARLSDDSSKVIALQDFVTNGESFVPIFSDIDQFRSQTKGSGFESQGVEIARNLLAAILRGDELLILNPGSDNPARLQKADLARPDLVLR